MNLRLAIASFLIIAATTSFAQELIPNFEGKWEGTANWGLKTYDMIMEFKQNGSKLSGTAITSNLNNENLIHYEFEGEVVRGTALVKGVKLIEKKGISHCMPGIGLQFSETDPNQLLGKWRANKGWNSCLVPGTGGLTLEKVDKTPISEPSRVVAIAETDNRGNALTAELQKQKFYALIIAVQDYNDESVIDLNQPISDATALRDELVAEYAFKPTDITFLQNPTRSDIIESFDALTATVQQNDNFLIFYAGHGIWDEQIEQGYWLPSDAKKSSKAAWLSNGTIRDYIRAIDSKHTLLITDACFSGGILKTREAFTASKAMLEMYKLPSRRAMTSGALKTVPDKSVFIEYLIKALRANEQPLISADQLFTSFKYNVINNSPNGQVPQYGVISQADDEGGDFIFLKQQ